MEGISLVGPDFLSAIERELDMGLEAVGASVR